MRLWIINLTSTHSKLSKNVYICLSSLVVYLLRFIFKRANTVRLQEPSAPFCGVMLNKPFFFLFFLFNLFQYVFGFVLVKFCFNASSHPCFKFFVTEDVEDATSPAKFVVVVFFSSFFSSSPCSFLF